MKQSSWIRAGVIGSAIVALGACSTAPVEQQPVASPPVPEQLAPPLPQLPAVEPASRSQALCRSLAERLQQRDSDWLNHLIDDDRLIENILAPLTLDRSTRRAIATELESDIAGIAEVLLSDVEPGAIWKCTGGSDSEGSRTAVLRLKQSESVGYVALQLHEHAGELRIGDWLMYNRGLLFSTQMRTLLLGYGESIGLAGIQMSAGEQNALIEWAWAFAQNRYQDAWDWYPSLAAAARRRPLVLLTQLEVGAQLGQDKLDEAVAELTAQMGMQPAQSFLLNQYYFSRRDWPAASRALDVFAADVGEDAYTHLGRAAIELEQGQSNNAIAHLKRAIQAEPDLEDSYWGLAFVLNEGGHYRELALLFELIERRFPYDISPASVAENTLYSDFAASAEFERWRDGGS